jgi:hypothetical protein
MIPVACVLRSGGLYGPAHVVRLRDMLVEHAPAGTELICLTDMPDLLRVDGIRVRGIQHRWPGWWSKIELLSLPGPLLYLDLDVTICRPLAPLLAMVDQHPFLISRDFWDLWPHQLNSSVMSWRGGAVRHVYEAFVDDPAGNMEGYATGERWNDQGWIRDHYEGDLVFFQDLLPGSVMSYKREILGRRDPTDNLIVCVFHGQPKPWDADVLIRRYAGPGVTKVGGW